MKRIHGRAECVDGLAGRTAERSRNHGLSQRTYAGSRTSMLVSNASVDTQLIGKERPFCELL